MTRRNIALCLVATGVAALYVLIYLSVEGYVAAMAVPRWWLEALPSWRTSALIWIFVSDYVAIVLISLPFAWLLGRLYGRFGTVAAFAVAVLAWGTLAVPPMMGFFQAPGAFLKVAWLVSTAELLVTLPILVWVLQRLPSNNRRGP